MENLHYFICTLLCFFGYMVCVTVNPVESVLFLILSFCSAAAILFMFNAEFLGLIFIIIYVGAIAVLFLFVIMMLNIKNTKPKSNSVWSFLYFSLFFIVFEIFWSIIAPYVIKEYLPQNLEDIDQYYFVPVDMDLKFLSDHVNVFFSEGEDLSSFLFIDNLSNIDIMGQALFNYYLVCFLLTGLILLVALVGSIVLTLRFNNSKESQHVHRQLSRTDNFLSFFK